jgi:hypothetical protein
MDGALVLAGKLAIGLACAWASFTALRWRGLSALSPRAFDALVLGTALATRATLAVALYGVLEQPVLGDVLGSYVPQGRAILEGRALFRDFSTSYGPLFPFEAAALLALWNEPAVFVWGAIVLELLSLALWLSAGRRIVGEAALRAGSVLYVTSPIPLLNVAMNGGQQVWVAVFLGACALLLARRRDFAAGAVLGAALVCVKLLAGVFAPVGVLFAHERVRFALGFASLPLAVYVVAFLCAGARAFEGAIYEAGQITPGNLYFLLSAVGADLVNPVLSAAAALVALAGAAALVAWLWRSGAASDLAYLPTAWGLALLAFLLLSKKSYPTYLVLGFFPLCLGFAQSAPRTRDVALFGVLGIAATLEMSLWFRWLDTRDFSLLWADALPRSVDGWGVLGFALCDGLLLLCYACVAARLATAAPGSARGLAALAHDGAERHEAEAAARRGR